VIPTAEKIIERPAARDTNASCMTQGAAPPISVYPDSHDFAELQTIYNHAN